MSIVNYIFNEHLNLNSNDSDKIKRKISDIEERYSEPWRHYHTLDHIKNLYGKMIDYKKEMESYAGVKVSNKNKSILKLVLAILYHDVVYYPWCSDNEKKSAEYFIQNTPIDDADINDWVYYAILATKNHIAPDQNFMTPNDSKLVSIFLEWDMNIVKSENVFDLLEWEKNIWKEYSFSPTKEYKKERIKFLKLYENDNKNIEKLICQVEKFKPKVAFYAGSFDPFHIGHLSIINQAQNIYDKVVVLIGQNPNKKKIDTLEKTNRISKIFSHVPGIEVYYFDGFLSNYLKSRTDHEDVYLIRGVRNTEDWAAESNFLRYSQDLWKDLKVQYFTCPKEIEHVSSSGIRALENEKTGSGNIYIPKSYDV